MRRPLLVLALCALVLAAAPAVSRAQGSTPLGPLPAPQQTPTTGSPSTPASSSSRSGGIGTGAQIGLFATGALLLAGIATVIVRDARRSAPRSGAERRQKRARAPAKPASAPPGARGRPTGKRGAARRRRPRGR